MLAAMWEILGDDDGALAYLGSRDPSDRRFGPLEKRIVNIEAEPFGAIDSTAALRALEQVNADYLIVSALDPPILPWPSETATTIHELLRDAAPPPEFQPLVIGRAHILYRVAPTLEVTDAQMAAMTAYLRARLTGGSPPRDPELPADDRARSPDGKVRVIVALRGIGQGCRPGRSAGNVIGEGNSLREALDSAGVQLRSGWSRDRRRLGCNDSMSNLDAAARHLTLQIELIHRMAAVCWGRPKTPPLGRSKRPPLTSEPP
jgi:hypothetical protein